jgi:hypothetical protein
MTLAPTVEAARHALGDVRIAHPGSPNRNERCACEQILDDVLDGLDAADTDHRNAHRLRHSPRCQHSHWPQARAADTTGSESKGGPTAFHVNDEPGNGVHNTDAVGSGVDRAPS